MKLAAGTTIVLIALVLGASEARALINPNFTPLHLTAESQLIVELKPGKIDAKAAVFSIVDTLKGKADQKEVTISLTGVRPEQVEALQRALKGRSVASFYVGKYRDPDAPRGGGEFDGTFGGDFSDGEPADEPAGILRALLHVGRPWFSIARTEKGIWKLEAQDDPMLGTWDGAPEMLLRAVRYILKDDEATMPSEASVAMFADVATLAKLHGNATALQAVDVAGDGKLAMFVLSKAGDQLLGWGRAEAFVDLSAEIGLVSKSVAATWADLDGDGRLDLASWDGATLVRYVTGADGKLAAAQTAIEGKMPAKVVAITSVASRFAGQAALVLSSPAGATVLTPKGDGQYLAAALPVPEAAVGKLGQAGAALVADFDNDARPDLLVPFETGGLLYVGTKQAGVFAAAKTVRVCFGKLPGGAGLGDWDGDGLMDVFVAAVDGCRMYQNLGGGVFVESIRFCGETYKTTPGGIAGGVCEINNDGRQDLWVAYGGAAGEEAALPQLYFNRGFRSFGYDVDANVSTIGQAIPDAAAGQRGGLMVDLNDDGGPDLAVILADGRVQVLLGEENEDAVGVRVILPAAAKAPGPVNVTAHLETRSLGSWTVRPGGPGAYFGLEDPQEVTIRWRTADGKVHVRQMEVEEGRTLLKLGSE